MSIGSIPGQPLRGAFVVCSAGALAAVAAGVAIGTPTGIAVAGGLVLGSVNPFLAERSVGWRLGMAGSALVRLGLLSAAGILLGVALGGAQVIPVLLAMAAAQLVVVGVSLRELAR